MQGCTTVLHGFVGETIATKIYHTIGQMNIFCKIYFDRKKQEGCSIENVAQREMNMVDDDGMMLPSWSKLCLLLPTYAPVSKK